MPALQAHSTLRYAAWRAVVAEFVAVRLGARPDDLLPRLVGHLFLGAALTAMRAVFSAWHMRPEADADALGALVEEAFDALSRGFSAT